MTVQWYRVNKTYEKPQGGFLAIGPPHGGSHLPRYCSA